MGFFSKLFGKKPAPIVTPPHPTFEYVALQFTTCKITGIKANDATVVIPAAICGFSVVEIGEGAFAKCTTLEHLEFSEGVKTVGANAFSECTSLCEVRLPSTLSYIGKDAFANCNKLTKASFAGSIARWRRVKREEGWHVGTDEMPLVCKDGYTSIDDMDWNVDDKGQTFISSGLAWEQPPMYVNSNKCRISGPGSCMDTRIVFPSLINGMTVTGVSGFRFYNEITDIKISENTQYIGKDAFFGCTALKTVNLPMSLVEISDTAFRDCRSLKEFIVPINVTILHRGAFAECINLKTVYLPRSIKDLCEEIFFKCSSLSKIIYSGTVAEWEEIDKNDDWAKGAPSFTVVCTNGTVACDADGNKKE